MKSKMGTTNITVERSNDTDNKVILQLTEEYVSMSLVVWLAAQLSGQPLTHQEVIKHADILAIDLADEGISLLFNCTIRDLNHEKDLA